MKVYGVRITAFFSGHWYQLGLVDAKIFRKEEDALEAKKIMDGKHNSVFTASYEVVEYTLV